MVRTPGWRHAARGVVAALLTLSSVSALADVKPGDKIDAHNVDKVKELISPGLEWCIKRGFPITIGETKRIEWPKAYKEATEKYSGQVKLSADGLTVSNYVAGLPFPNVDEKDAQIAHKIMWNYDYKFHSTDDVDLRNFDADTGSIADHGPMTVERHFLLDHLRRSQWRAKDVDRPAPTGFAHHVATRSQLTAQCGDRRCGVRLPRVDSLDV